MNRQLGMEIGELAGELVATLVAAWSERDVREATVHHVAVHPSGTRGRGYELRASRRPHTERGSRADGFLLPHDPRRNPPRPAASKPVRDVDQLADSYGARIASWLASRCQICPTTGRYLRVERLPPSAREDRRTVSVASLMLSRPGMRRTLAACPRRAS